MQGFMPILLDFLLIAPIISNYLPISMFDKLKFNLCNSSDYKYNRFKEKGKYKLTLKNMYFG